MIAPPHWECVGLEGTRYHAGWCKGSVGGCCYPVLLVLVPTCTHPRLKIVLWMQGYHIFPLIIIHFLCKEGLSFSSRNPTRKIIKISLRRKAHYLILLEPFSWFWGWASKTQSKKNKCWNKTRSSSLNCALRDDEAVYWVSVRRYEAVAVGNWWYFVSRGHLCLYILHKVEIWTGVTDASLTDWQLWKIGLLSSL